MNYEHKACFLKSKRPAGQHEKAISGILFSAGFYKEREQVSNGPVKK